MSISTVSSGRMLPKARKKKISSARTAKSVRPAAKKSSGKKGTAGFDRFKTFNGKLYTGVQIGRGHHWNYDKGDWKETKITPDLWEISYAVTKRRVGKAPEDSGVPVGTQYHWYILAHQTATKLNANDYDTKMTGLKFKLAHKRACAKGFCYELDVTLNDDTLGIIRYGKSGWKMDLVKDQKLVDAIGAQILQWYE